MNTFGDRLRHRREQLKMSRSQLAESVGLSAKTIQRYEERDEPPQRSDAQRRVRELADVLRTRVRWLKEAHGDPALVKGSGDGRPKASSSGIVVVPHRGRIPEGASSYDAIPDQPIDRERFAVLFGGRSPDGVCLYRMATSCAEPYFFPHEDIPVEKVEEWEIGDLYVMEADGRRRLARIIDQAGNLYGETLDGRSRFPFDDTVSVNGRVILNRIKCEVLRYFNGELVESSTPKNETSNPLSGPRTVAG